jgi:hypothetical protein
VGASDAERIDAVIKIIAEDGPAVVVPDDPHRAILVVSHRRGCYVVVTSSQRI